MDAHWWKQTSIYQVYPRSFYDANSDGIGDLRGLIAKLDYIQDLGFETIWLSPHYVSPQVDFGYDIANFRDVAPEYGTLEDAQALIDAVHSRGMKIVFDMILNHTSNKHPWFLESRSSRDNPKRDWYIWKDGRGPLPPNNWRSIPGNRAWSYDKVTKQWFCHNFLPFQPDLNFRNPEVKQEMFDTLRFWLDRGVDGFRLDIFHSIFKDDQFRNNPLSWHLFPTQDFQAGFLQQLKYNLHRPETFELAKEVRSLLDEYQNPARFAVGEVFGEHAKKNYLGDKHDGLNLILMFELTYLKKISCQGLRDIIRINEKNYPEPLVPCYFFGNHDVRRYSDKFSGNAQLAKLLAFFLYTVRCVPITYYGDELALPDGDFPAKGGLDSLAKGYAWMPLWFTKVMGIYVNRDGCRTPMQWDDTENAGFSSTTPWLPVHSDYVSCNVAAQKEQDYSVLNIHKRLLGIRKKQDCLRSGSIELLEKNIPKDVLVFERYLDNQDQDQEGYHSITVLNFSEHEQTITLAEGLTLWCTSEAGCVINGQQLSIQAKSAALLG